VPRLLLDVKQSKLAVKSAFGGRPAVAEGTPGRLGVAISGHQETSNYIAGTKQIDSPLRGRQDE
jgi:hypothetical protein